MCHLVPFNILIIIIIIIITAETFYFILFVESEAAILSFEFSDSP